MTAFNVIQPSQTSRRRKFAGERAAVAALADEDNILVRREFSNPVGNRQMGDQYRSGRMSGSVFVGVAGVDELDIIPPHHFLGFLHTDARKRFLWIPHGHRLWSSVPPVP